jgi:hypothetical protein
MMALKSCAVAALLIWSILCVASLLELARGDLVITTSANGRRDPVAGAILIGLMALTVAGLSAAVFA